VTAIPDNRRTATADQLNTALAGRYRIERELGRGGMATVYLAHDVKHDRRVAVKVLKPELAAVLGAERFVVEIKTTAALQHPHILPLFDSGTADGMLYYVMPYIEGETIREKLNRETQFGVDEAIRVAREVADALDYAHRRGVIHRDIKPENILLHDGRAMVMDFGIALAVSAAAGGRMTETGLSLGTPHYMSPEQATAEKDITPRSDIYSLASVLYEMLGGAPPHVGGSAQQIIMKIIAEPARPVTTLRKSVPPHVSAALDKALEKLAADRFESARAFSDALVNAAFTTTVNGRPRTSAVPGVSTRTFIATTAGLVLLSIGLAAWGFTRPPPTPSVRARFTLEAPDSQAASLSYGQLNLAVAPNGTEIIYPGAGRTGVVLYRRRLNDLSPVEIPRSDAPASVTYSPDGRDVVMQGAAQELYRVTLDGGSATRLVPRGLRPSWDVQATILFVEDRKLWSIAPTGGTPTLVAADSGANLDYPHFLPDGKTVIYNRLLGRSQAAEIWLLNATTGSRRQLEITGLNPRYVSSGHLLSTNADGAVLAAPFDLRSLRVLGPAVPVLDQGPSFIGTAKFDISNTGVLVYAEGRIPIAPAIADYGGRLQILGFAPSLYAHPRIAPGGDQIAIERAEGTHNDIYILTRATRQMLRLTHDGKSRSPEWSPDGNRVFWIRGDDSATTLLSQSADGSGQPQTITTSKVNLHRFQVAPNGKFIAMAVGPSRRHDLVLIPLDGTSQTREITKTVGDEVQPTVSPDGKWIAYASNEGSRRFEVYISSVENPATRIQVSTEGATAPVWTADGKTLVFCTATHFVAAELRFSPRIEVAKRDTLFTNDYRAGAADRVFDYDPKTRSFLVLTSGPNARSRIVVATGWFEELRERAPRTVGR
jgi:eukaryotic-like serine/threonine-protein kinase